MAWSLSQTLSLSFSPPLSSRFTLSTTTRIRNSFSYTPRSSLPSKRFHSKNNRLRQKLLKTLSKPPQNPIPNPAQDTHQTPTIPFNQEAAKEEVHEENEVKETAFSHSPVVPSAFGFDSPGSFINLVFYILGMFVFQTICTIWILGSADIDEISGDSVEMEGGEKNGDLGLSSDGLELEKRVSEIQILAREARASEERKARDEASASFSAAVGNDGDDFVVETASSRHATVVRKEVDRRLLNLQKSIQTSPGDSLQRSNSGTKGANLAVRKRQAVRVSLMNGRNDPKGFGCSKSNKNLSVGGESGLLDNEEQRADLSDGNAMEEVDSHLLNDEVLNRVMLKFQANEEAGRDPLNGLGSEEEMNFFLALQRKFEKEGMDNAKQWMEKRMEGIDLSYGGAQRSDHEKPLEESMRPYETTKPIIQRNIYHITDKLMERSKSGRGTFINDIEDSNRFQEEFQNSPSRAENSLQDKNYASKISEGTSNQNEGPLNEIKSRESGTKISRRSKNLNQGALSKSGKKIRSSSTGSTNSQLRVRKSKNRVSHKVKDSGSDIENDFWWLDLPYVLAILLNRSSDSEAPRGLYSLKMKSHLENEGSSSYIVAFEDQGDATNFCFLLESFFEDLGDFSADVVPLSIKHKTCSGT
ncbi:wound-responsive family protein [Cinnamomum micranthum f. kanehirae]|uniref:Wound-responsive family protein n=1 Tax=Cinnamomum micranthum f. kanehirae TaxID=337451 RepID=A0A443PV79_9MAGN|nr:wound-responsive family protein [Cinnamomum micranthum f. kanehirae]